MRIFIFLAIIFISDCVTAQKILTPFERSSGLKTATYAECIEFYKQLDRASTQISVKPMGMSDAGYPYHLVLFSKDGKFDPSSWHKQNKVVILVINGIHPGEPDGVDASMLLLRDAAEGRIQIPENIALAVIPMYNIGGALIRNSYSRVNQNGPESYGFRGNSQNLDLNRDFTKNDSRDSKSFTSIFHWLNPDIQLDNHVSDGADHQYTMTLITTQWNKLGGACGDFIHNIFQPALYKSMAISGWAMCPYVNFEEGDTEKGWEEFYDSPRYSSGYAALFHTFAFISETHMLKPFKDRVHSTYALMQSIIEFSSQHAIEIHEKRKLDFANDMDKVNFDLVWKTDSSRFDSILFKGYTAGYKASEITGQPRLYYDQNKPFEKNVKFFDYYKGIMPVRSPEDYVIPQGWHDVIDLLKLNGVRMGRLARDSIITVETYRIDSFSSTSVPYEKHHRNDDVRISKKIQPIQFLAGDYIITTHQPAKRFLIEMLEPEGDDSYFSWNFFDAILQQKENYSNYRWEDVAGAYVAQHPELRKKLEDKKNADAAFSQNSSAQLEFVFRNSPYYETSHLRYPVFRIIHP